MSYSPPQPPRPRPRPNPGVDACVSTCLKALRALPTRREKVIALGQIIAGLMHSNELSGATQVLQEVIAAVNHYTAPIEPRAF